MDKKQCYYCKEEHDTRVACPTYKKLRDESISLRYKKPTLWRRIKSFLTPKS